MPPTRPFRFGVINETPLAPDQWLAQVRRAEELGYDTLLIRDHLVPDVFGDQYAPLVALATAAAVTTRLHVGTMVIDNDFRHPVLLAKEAATLDALSGGRFELGIGAGWLRDEYERAGLQYDRAAIRIDRLEESLAIIKRLFREGCVSFTGKHYQVTEQPIYPAPARPAGPPILIGGGKKRMLRLAGREADIVGLLTTSVSTGALSDDPTERLAASVEQKLGWVREGAGDRYDDLQLSLILSVTFTSDRERHAATLIRDRGWTGITVHDVLEMPSVFIGTPDQIAEQMTCCRDRWGFSYFVISDEIMEEFALMVERLAGR